MRTVRWSHHENILGGSIPDRKSHRYKALTWTWTCVFEEQKGPAELDSSTREAGEGAERAGEGLGSCSFQNLNQNLNHCLLSPPEMVRFPGSGLGVGHRLVSFRGKLG